MPTISWEQAVQWLREKPDQQELVRACYFDDPLIEAAERFWQSVEWQSIAALLPHSKGRALDLGAGRGISSYALARDGWAVSALEPDPSNLVGAGAIRTLVQESGLPIEVGSVPGASCFRSAWRPDTGQPRTDAGPSRAQTGGTFSR